LPWKEVDRQIEQGDKPQALKNRTVEYSKRRLTRQNEPTAIASEEPAQQVREIGIRELMRFGGFNMK
jgi:hypothetical protein